MKVARPLALSRRPAVAAALAGGVVLAALAAALAAPQAARAQSVWQPPLHPQAQAGVPAQVMPVQQPLPAATPPAAVAPPVLGQPQPVVVQTGTVESVTPISTQTAPRDRTEGAGIAAGAILGAVAGRGISTTGSSGGKNVATIVGAVAGGLLGHQIERSMRGGGTQSAAVTGYRVVVRMDDGSLRQFDSATPWQVGTRVSYDLQAQPAPPPAAYVPVYPAPKALPQSAPQPAAPATDGTRWDA
jgi:outer membrane lipoprotein SlyB